MKKLWLVILFCASVVYSEIGDVLDAIDDQQVKNAIEESIIETDGVAQTIPGIITKSTHLSESYYRLYLVIGILITSVIFLWIILKQIGKTETHNSDDIVTGAGLVIVVMGTLFIVIASTTTEALTAAIGLLGAVGGYVFGNLKKEKQAHKEAPKVE